MPQGLQCWDASGNLVLDVTDRLTRILGEVGTGTTSGSVNDANFATGTPWFFVRDNSPQTFDESGIATNYPCRIWIDGNTLNWEFSTSTAYPISRNILYGVY